jgi:predicted ATP-dependent serine protease
MRTVPNPVEGEGTLSLADVDDEEVMAIRTGTGLDLITGAGLPEKSVILLWGVEGAGKSRLALCAADGWCGTTQGQACYLLRESMSLTMLRRMAREHGLGHLYSIIPRMVEGDFTFEIARRGVWGPTLWVFDSANDERIVLAAQEHLRSHLNDAVVVIAQATKEGEFRGTREMAHESDVVAEVVRKSDESRLLNVTKNRFGTAGVRECPWPPHGGGIHGG